VSLFRNDVKPLLNKQELQRAFQTTPVPQDLNKLLQGLYDMLDWQRGEDITVNSATAVSQTASQTSQPGPSLVPPDGEEWEVLAVWVLDGAKIDQGDSVGIMLYDQNMGTNPVDLQSFSNTGFLGANSAANIWAWPNTVADRRNIPYFPIRLRVINPALSYTRKITTLLTTSAVVGTRSFRAQGFVRRRLI
jgi:hypothetical protein